MLLWLCGVHDHSNKVHAYRGFSDYPLCLIETVDPAVHDEILLTLKEDPMLEGVRKDSWVGKPEEVTCNECAAKLVLYALEMDRA